MGGTTYRRGGRPGCRVGGEAAEEGLKEWRKPESRMQKEKTVEGYGEERGESGEGRSQEKVESGERSEGK